MSFESDFPQRFERLCRTAAAKCKFDLPEDTLDLLVSILKSRKTETGRVYTMVARPRKTATDRQRAFHTMVQWHTGQRNANLWGPNIAAMRCDSAADFDRIDSLAQIAAWALTGRTSAGVAAWSRAFLGS